MTLDLRGSRWSLVVTALLRKGVIRGASNADSHYCSNLRRWVLTDAGRKVIE